MLWPSWLLRLHLSLYFIPTSSFPIGVYHTRTAQSTHPITIPIVAFQDIERNWDRGAGLNLTGRISFPSSSNYSTSNTSIMVFLIPFSSPIYYAWMVKWSCLFVSHAYFVVGSCSGRSDMIDSEPALSSYGRIVGPPSSFPSLIVALLREPPRLSIFVFGTAQRLTNEPFISCACPG